MTNYLNEILSENSDSPEGEEDLMDSNSVPFQTKFVPIVEQNLKIINTRDSLIAQKDHHIIFIGRDGSPGGAREYAKINKLPRYVNITFEQACVTINNKYLISLPIKLNARTLVEFKSVTNSIRPLINVIRKFTSLQLSSLSITQTDRIDVIPWFPLRTRLIQFLSEFPLTLTVCKSLIRCPEVNERQNLIYEQHAIKIGGDKGISKTYNRLRQNFYWPTMKKDIQECICNCRMCQIKKLIRVKTKQPMIITDTSGTAFEKISMDCDVTFLHVGHRG